MDNKKEQERAELHKTIWRIANDLRGAIDGWDFKQYVLGFLFYRFISENLKKYINDGEIKAGNKNFDYALLSDEQAEYGRNATVIEKGFYILPSELFENVRKNASKDKDLNITLKKVFDNIENSAKGTPAEKDVKGLFADIDVNSNKLGNTVIERNVKLVKMLDSIGELNLGNYKDNTIDTFGDAYEFLMTMYASNAGKSGGEFFTPQEVGELLAKITLVDKTEVNKVYDPCCGSGGLLLKFAKVLGKENVKQGFYGQENNLTTYNLCRINMFLHDINYNNFDIALGDTLLKPAHWDNEPFDAIVSNPPYSTKWEGKNNPLLINDPRFAPAGVLAPAGKADYAFILHMLSWLSEKGTAAIVEYTGALRRPLAEKKIRKYLVDNNYIDSIINMPTNLFFGTPIDTCIMVLKKSKKTNDIAFIDARDEYIKNTKNNVLSKENIDNIIAYYKDRVEVENKCIIYSNEDIKKRNYNLYVTEYTHKKDDVIEESQEEISEKIHLSMIQQNEIRKDIEEIRNEISKIINGNEDVEIKPLEEIVDYIQPNKYRVSSTHYDDSFKTPVLTAGQTFILGYTNEQNDIFEASKKEPVIIFDDFTTSSQWVDFNFKVKSSAMKILVPKDENIILKYVYYYIKKLQYQPTEHARQWIQTFSKIEIPIPKKELQLVLINLLDSINYAEKELMKELLLEKELREKEYNHIINRILNFEE